MESSAYEELYQLEPGHWWYKGMRQITRGLLDPYLPDPRNLRILDAGCGVGGNLAEFTRYGTPYGVDYSSLALAYAKRSYNGALGYASVERLPFPTGLFDLVTSFDVLYCLEVLDDQRAICEFARVLRPDGLLLIRLPALEGLRGTHDIVVHGVRRYTTLELRNKITEAGLQVLRLTYLNSLLLPLIYVTRRWQNFWQGFNSTPSSDVHPTPEPFNYLLSKILSLEAAWIARRHNFPVGVSVMCLAIKPEEPTPTPIYW